MNSFNPELARRDERELPVFLRIIFGMRKGRERRTIKSLRRMLANEFSQGVARTDFKAYTRLVLEQFGYAIGKAD